MSAEELIEALSKLPPHAVVVMAWNGHYGGNWSPEVAEVQLLTRSQHQGNDPEAGDDPIAYLSF